MPRNTRKAIEGYDDALPTRLRQLLEETGTSQKQLGEAIGVTPQTISLYATNGSKPDWKTIVTIADYFDVSTDWMLGRTDTRSPDTTIQSVCNYTGLSDAAVEILHGLTTAKKTYTNLRKAINALFEQSFESYSLFGEPPVKIPLLLSDISAFLNSYFPEKSSILIRDDGTTDLSSDPAVIEAFFSADDYLRALDLKDIQLRMAKDHIIDSLEILRTDYQKSLGHRDYDMR